MRVVKQKEFDEFCCAADKCPDNCCGGWQIEIDRETLEYLKEYRGDLRDAIDRAVDFEHSCIKMNKDGRCELLNDKGLCRLVLEEGEEVLSTICHMYPRHVEEYDGIREWSVSLSCPIAAKMLINKTDKSEYTVSENDDPEPLEDDFEDFDFLLFTKLEDSRDIIFNILNDRDLSIYTRMKRILQFCDGLQNMLDKDRMFDMDELINDAASGDLWDHARDFTLLDDEHKLISYIKDKSVVLYRLERLKSEWEDVLARTAEFNNGGYNIMTSYEKAISGLDSLSHDIILENILHTFIYTYFLGAVYDDMIYAKASMSVFCTLLIDHLYVAECTCRDDGIGMDKYIGVAYRFAKEAEHSDINLNILEEYSEGLFKNAE